MCREHNTKCMFPGKEGIAVIATRPENIIREVNR